MLFVRILSKGHLKKCESRCYRTICLHMGVFFGKGGENVEYHIMHFPKKNSLYSIFYTR